MTINGDGPPSDHRRTTGQRRLTASQPVSHGWVWAGSVQVWIWSGLGPPCGMPRGATCQPAWQLTWRGGDYNPPAFRTQDLYDRV
ncbi:hypothetical protein Tco_0198154, partial [Tanacetum coccineum]